jgi:Protein of unknown function (DUF3800)
VYLLFLDESGVAGGTDFVLGGVAIAGDRWYELRRRWNDTRGLGGEYPESEIKWSRVKRSSELIHRLADLLIDCDATAFAVHLRPHEARKAEPELFKSGEHTYATGLMFLAERFQYFLAAKDDYGAIVIDHRNGNQDDRLRLFFRRLADKGTPFMTLDRIVDPIMLSPSHHTLGIQAADLVVGPILTLSRAEEPGLSQRRVEQARELHQRLLPCFARHPKTGRVEGVGIKRFPEPSPHA